MTAQFGYGQMRPNDYASDFAAHSFLINQILGRIRTTVLVQVKSADANGEVAPPGFVSVQPLVSMVDGNNNAVPHGTVFNIPVFRLMGGGNAVICDPAVGDIGWMAICDRDISAVKTTKAVASPGSYRRFDFADGVYIGGLFGEAPTQYIRFTSDGIEIADKNGNVIEMKVGSIEITTTALVINGTTFGTHVHATAAVGAPSPPTPGS